LRLGMPSVPAYAKALGYVRDAMMVVGMKVGDAEALGVGDRVLKEEGEVEGEAELELEESADAEVVAEEPADFEDEGDADSVAVPTEVALARPDAELELEGRADAERVAEGNAEPEAETEPDAVEVPAARASSTARVARVRRAILHCDGEGRNSASAEQSQSHTHRCV